MKKIAAIFFCICLSAINGFGQGAAINAEGAYSISGTVSDNKGQPVPGATVFLTNTKKITAADPTGKFILNGITPGSYEMVIKMLGFKQNIQNINLQDKAIIVNIRLDEAAIGLNAVTIKGTPPRDQKKYLALFIKYFFGQTSYASQCKILNPEVLKFHYTERKGGDLFEASADDFIIIENKALGYKLRHLLTQFIVDYKKNTYTTKGYTYFEELNGSADQQKKWDGNRRAAYLSSDRHFYRAVLNNTAAEEGFYVYKTPDVPIINYHDGNKEYIPADWVRDPIFIDTLFKPYGNYRALISKSKIGKRDTLRPTFFIIYTGHPVAHPIDYANRQISVMYPIVDTILIDKNGSVTPESTPITNGYWADGQAATLLPLEYVIDSSLKTGTKGSVIKDTGITH